MSRVYLDHNATTPLRPEARAAMIAAMDVVGNPSSVHAEGRAAKAIVEKARGQVAALVGCKPAQVVFTSGATEASAMVFAQDFPHIIVGATEHDAVFEPATRIPEKCSVLPVNKNGFFTNVDFLSIVEKCPKGSLVALQSANGETGVSQGTSTELDRMHRAAETIRFVDLTQTAGKHGAFNNSMYSWRCEKPEYACLSSHKLGGPKGVGALIVRQGVDFVQTPLGGGQESGRRSGTENVIGIAGFGAAAIATNAEFDEELEGRISFNMGVLERRLLEEAYDMIVFGSDERVNGGPIGLPNTLNFAVPGWKGETQVMQMDLAGFAVSAGSACSSGKVKASRVLKAMGYDDITASSAIRVSIGPTTTKGEVERFADTWIEHYRRYKQRAA